MFDLTRTCNGTWHLARWAPRSHPRADLSGCDAGWSGSLGCLGSRYRHAWGGGQHATWIREHCRFNSRRAPAYLGYRRRPSLLIFWICLLATASLSGCTNPYLPYVFYIDEDGTRSLIDVCDEPLPRIEVLEVDADYDETGQVIGSYVPPAGSTSSTVVLGEETQGYTPGVDVSDGTWASLAIVYNNGETGLIVPWTDLPRGSGYTFQDELVEGSLDEIISSTRKDVPCWSDE